MKSRTPTIGSVTLVGGGPGPVDLMTMRAIRALEAADVVLYDRLGPRTAHTQYAPTAKHIYVGKRPGHHRMTQSDINASLVEHALLGRNVVRLKGGDPYVFGRGGEELDACVLAGIPVSVVPGISSALSVPGAAGIPVTHRGISTKFTVISGHDPLSSDECRALALLGGTVVILMGMGTLNQTVQSFMDAGFADQTPAAIIERGLSEQQRITTAPLPRLAQAAHDAGCVSPAVVVIGEVAARCVQTGQGGSEQFPDDLIQLISQCRV